MFNEAIRLNKMSFIEKQKFISLRMLHHKERILFEKPGAFCAALPLGVPAVHWMIHAHISGKRDVAERQSTPCKIGVFTKMGMIKAYIESANLLEDTPTQK